MLTPVLDRKKLRSSSSVKIALIGLAVVLCLGGIGVGGYVLWGDPPPKPPPSVETSTMADNADYLAGPDFERLPANERLAWFEGQMAKAVDMDDDAFFETCKNVDESKRERIRTNLTLVMRDRLRRDVADFQKLPASEKDAFLDERIDQMRQAERKFNRVVGRGASTAPGFVPLGGSRRRGARAGGTPDADREFQRQERKAFRRHFNKQMRRFMVEESGDQRAKTVKYVTAMGRREIQRSLERLIGRSRK